MIFTALRVVDNKAILYFDAPSTSAALTWCRGMSACLSVVHVVDILCSNKHAYTGLQNIDGFFSSLVSSLVRRLLSLISPAINFYCSSSCIRWSPPPITSDIHSLFAFHAVFPPAVSTPLSTSRHDRLSSLFSSLPASSFLVSYHSRCL